MPGYQSATDASKGSPNLEAIQMFQDQLPLATLKNIIFVETVSITASGTTAVKAVNIPQGATIVDVVVHCTYSNASGTITVRKADAGASITDAIACETLDALDRAATIDQTYKVVGADGIECVANGADDKGDVYIYYKK